MEVEEGLYYHPTPLPWCHLQGAVQVLPPKHFFLTLRAELLPQLWKQKKPQIGFKKPVHSFTCHSAV